MNNTGYIAVAIALLIFLPGLSSAQVCSPWVLKKGQPDTRVLSKTVHALYSQVHAETHRERAETIWRFLFTDGRFVEPGIFYHIGGWAYEEPLGEVLDPLKLLNSYGFGLCYQIAPLLEALYDAGGFADSRVWFLTGHTVAEVFFDGKYNMLDSDMLGYTTLGSGDPYSSPIASVHELEGDEQIILGKMLAPGKADSARVVFPWYPADVRARAMRGYAKLFSTKKNNFLFPFTRYSSGHTMDFVLRPGERLVRFFEPEFPGLFYLPYKKTGEEYIEFPREIQRWKICTENGPHSQKDSRAWATGRIEYKPPMWRKDAYYPFFAPGFNRNLHLPCNENGALAREDSSRPGTAVFEMPSPYVLIDAAFSLSVHLAGPAHRIILETSTDRGGTWRHAGTLTGPFTGLWKCGPEVLTTSEHRHHTAVSGCYGYLVRLTLSGPAEPRSGVGIRDLELASLIQLNPRTLPALDTGVNELVYSPGPQLVRRSMPVDIRRLDEFAHSSQNLVCFDEDNNCLLRPGVRENMGEVIFELSSSPDNAELKKFHAGGRFIADGSLAPEKTTAETRETALGGSHTAGIASIAWSYTPDGPYTGLWDYDPGSVEWLDSKKETRLLRWPEVDLTVDGLTAGTSKVYLRYRLRGMALDDVRLAVFTAATAPFDREKSSRLEITHVWNNRGVRHSRIIKINDPERKKSYRVDTGRWGVVENRALILACPARQQQK
ncbi:MAG: hypothetical protein U9N45_05695 [Gemmatimonadota bacterium]|nr:hypothetical protein [Gemmatimonadota bacterium]